MFSFVTTIFCLFISSLTATKATDNNTSHGGKAIIIDTDIMGDVDDIGALAVANVLYNCGMADLKAVMINTNSSYGSLATSAINTYFGNGDVPIAASPSSITIISLGFLNNLATLLKSSNGTSLIETKVAELVIMGGAYPGPGWEFNFGYQDPAATAYILENWPNSIPITYSGFDLGANIYSGSRLREHAMADSPVLAAYEWYVGRCSTTRESWDPVTTLYGILGLDGFSALGLQEPFAYATENGYNSIVEANGTNAWVNDASVKNQRQLKLADGVSNASVAWMLDQFYIHDPIDKSCFN
ncbi:hypothetical protein HII31_02649 [Pseudocercospora fuligena]|uniref:Inosine/uridine-preferring nucleoside hydrolase domain-containing protein n=1 Tax=Pseudocercospora fuligena TaxID=685502 RepID=A0A8H6RRI8_9PEZI|nr:hypothetical protein HII31_02649 [Pseudocercospora fuligena]